MGDSIGHDYRRIADRIAADITAGRLQPGQRLPPQRKFARRHGIAVTPRTGFAVDPKRIPDAVRLGLASAALPDLERALRTLADVAGDGPSAR